MIQSKPRVTFFADPCVSCSAVVIKSIVDYKRSAFLRSRWGLSYMERRMLFVPVLNTPCVCLDPSILLPHHFCPRNRAVGVQTGNSKPWSFVLRSRTSLVKGLLPPKYAGLPFHVDLKTGTAGTRLCFCHKVNDKTT